MRDDALEERASQAAATVRGQDREAEFGEIIIEGDVRRANERALFVVNAENRIVVEVDPVDVGNDGSRSKRRAEPETLILQGQREKMRGQTVTRPFGQALDGYRHQ